MITKSMYLVFQLGMSLDKVTETPPRELEQVGINFSYVTNEFGDIKNVIKGRPLALLS